MERILVKDLKEKETLQSVFLVKEKNIGLGKNGKPFISLLLGDNTGNIDAKVWDQVEDISKEFEAGDLIQIKGNVQLFQNRKQLIVSKVSRVDAQLYNFDDFVMKSSRSSEEMFSELLLVVKEFKNEMLKQLVLNVIEDTEIKPKLCKAPAAKTIHHAWYGGLLEHILSMVKILKSLADHYEYLNRDLLIFGAIFHDVGKIWELEYQNSFGYTDRGRLIGHMEMACELIDRKSQQIMGFSSELRDICKHIVISHHGKLEYGSMKRPKFLEAYLVAAVDELDSKMSTINQFIEGERASGERWSRYNESFERYFLLDDLKKKYE